LKRTKPDRELDQRMLELDERERYELKKLRASMGRGSLSAEGVGEVLPEAIVLSQAEDGRLPKSMVETTERAIGLSVEQDPAILSEALFPVIGAAIRKAVEHLVSEILFKMNAGLEKGLSLKRLGWRMEALRGGVPYYEIVLKHTLDYRVEHAFLIHKKTGILLADASLPGPSSMADKDLVASMLTAVRDYIKDSLALRKGDAVEVLSAGGCSIFVEEGPLALVALVVRGTADPAVRAYARDALETAHARLGPQLRSFDGEIAPFEKASQFLSPCLVSAEKGAAGKKPVYAIALLCLLAGACCFLAARAGLRSSHDRAFLAALDAEPGIVVVDARRSGGLLRAKLMRAGGAREIAAVAAERGFDLAGADLEVEPFLAPPTATALSPAPAPLSEVQAPASPARPGPAPAPPKGAADRAAALPSPAAPASPNVRLPSPSPSLAAPASGSGSRATAELAALAARLESLTILFDKNSGRPAAGQEGRVREIRSLATSMVDLALKNSLSPRIEAIGHAAGAVSDAAGDSVSVVRARRAVELVAGGDSRLAAYFSARGAGNGEPLASEVIAEGAARNRSASFTATFR
jgi:OOP family OmpA-OmpF porin